jgi:tetratricopeptide (TPR) repeat protein
MSARAPTAGDAPDRTIARHWERARAYLRQGNLLAASVRMDSLRALAPGDARTGALTAQFILMQGRPQDAATAALDAARVAGDDTQLLGDLIETLLQVGESAVAHDLLQRPIWQQATDADTLLRYADFRKRFGEHAQALTAFDRLVAMRPEDGMLRRHRGQQLEFLGRLAEAEAEYEACLTRLPGHGRAAYSLVRLRRQTDGDHHLAIIDSGQRQVLPGSAAHADFDFARYHVLEDLGQTDAAWQALAAANSTMHALAAADVAREQTGTQHFCELAATRPPRATSVRHDGPRPIFIIGLPRSGTTVLERMLANHSQVASAGELTDFGRQLLCAANSAAGWDADFFTRQLGLDFAEVGRGYLAQTRWRAGDKPFYIDKRPGNYLVAGLIHAALPEAKILHLVRDPMDAAFSIWRARFGSTYAWSYDFHALATHYAQYRRLMNIWHAAYPGAILDVPYAELVGEPATTLRRVQEFCGLDRQDGCEDLTRNTLPVSSLSSAQVREPLHAHALGHWRRYAVQLEPLRQLLSDFS